MNCKKYQKMIDSWIDKELSVSNSREFEHHLKSCNNCWQELEERKHLILAFRKSMSMEKTPRFLRDRLLSLPPSGKWKNQPALVLDFIYDRKRLIGGAAAMLIITLVLSIATYNRKDRVEWCQTFIDDHMESVFLKEQNLQTHTQSRDELSGWFSERLGCPISLPQFTGADLRGGRMCVLKGRLAGLAIYQLGQKKLSFFVAPAKSFPVPGWNLSNGSPHIVTENGFSLEAWEGKDLLQVIVSDLPPDQLSQLAKSVI